jgi:hypothetical protein
MSFSLVNTPSASSSWGNELSTQASWSESTFTPSSSSSWANESSMWGQPSPADPWLALPVPSTSTNSSGQLCAHAPPPKAPHNPEELYAGHPGQFQDETMDDFFRRRHRQNAKAAEKMNDVALQHIADLIKLNKGHPCPDTKSKVKVFVWETFPPYEPALFRRRVTKDAAASTFMSFNKSTRRYDPYKNEWDCYGGWSSDKISDETREADYIYGLDGDVPMTIPAPLPLATSPTSLPEENPPQHSTDIPQAQVPQGTDSQQCSPATQASTPHFPRHQPLAREDEPMAIDPSAQSEPAPSIPKHHPSEKDAPDDTMAIHHPPQLDLAPPLNPQDKSTEAPSTAVADPTVQQEPTSRSNLDEPPVRIDGYAWQDALLYRYGFCGFDLGPGDFAFPKKAIDCQDKTVKHLERAYLAKGERLPSTYYKPSL